MTMLKSMSEIFSCHFSSACDLHEHLLRLLLIVPEISAKAAVWNHSPCCLCSFPYLVSCSLSVNSINSRYTAGGVPFKPIVLLRHKSDHMQMQMYSNFILFSLVFHEFRFGNKFFCTKKTVCLTGHMMFTIRGRAKCKFPSQVYVDDLDYDGITYNK